MIMWVVWFMREFGSFHVWEFEKRLDCKSLNLTVVFWPCCWRTPSSGVLGLGGDHVDAWVF